MGHALRRLAHSPGFSLAVIVSIALGLDPAVAAFGLADALLFRPPPQVRDVDRLVDVRVGTYPDYVDLRDQALLQRRGCVVRAAPVDPMGRYGKGDPTADPGGRELDGTVMPHLRAAWAEWGDSHRLWRARGAKDCRA